MDWFTPDGLPTWGDGRLTILGTEGTIELRKYLDIAGRPGTDHLFLVDKAGTRHIDASGRTAAPGVAMDAVDTTGAGDCFAAAYVTAKLDGAPLPDRLRFANAAAALATLAYGAQAAMPRRRDVEQLLKSLAADPELERQPHA